MALAYVASATNQLNPSFPPTFLLFNTNHSLIHLDLDASLTHHINSFFRPTQIHTNRSGQLYKQSRRSINGEERVSLKLHFPSDSLNQLPFILFQTLTLVLGGMTGTTHGGDTAPKCLSTIIQDKKWFTEDQNWQKPLQNRR